MHGVGFRATAKNLASRYHLSGSARNVSDGTVEVIVQGPEKDVKAFLEQLKSTFQVTDVIEEQSKLQQLHDGFCIVF